MKHKKKEREKSQLQFQSEASFPSSQIRVVVACLTIYAGAK